MSDVFDEIRLSRALAIAVDKMLREYPEQSAETIEDVRYKYNTLNALYRYQMDREMS